MRRWIVIVASVALAAACTMPATSTRSSTGASAAPSPPAASDPTPSASATAAHSLDPLAPTVIPGLTSVDAIDGTVVLGRTVDDEAVLYDLADGTTTRLNVRLSPFPGDLGGGVAVGAGRGDDIEAGSAFVYDIATGTLRTIDFPHGLGMGRVTTDGRVVVGTRALTNGQVQATWVYHLDTGKLDRLAFLEGRTRGQVAGVSGTYMAGTFGADDDDQAWLYDFESGVETKLHPLFGGALSWVDGIAGDLVVGAIQTPKPWVDQAIVYDLATGAVTNLAAQIGESRALDVDGPIVVGGSSNGPFVYDHRTGEVRILSGGDSALAVSGDLVVGIAGDQVVLWNIASTP